jgi:hypothetical protein
MWLKTHPNSQWDKNIFALSVHFLTVSQKFITPCADERAVGKFGCKSWAKFNGLQFLEKSLQITEAKSSSITPKSTSTIDTLWCPPQDGRTTAEQVELRSQEGASDEIPQEDLDLYSSMLMDIDEDDDFA